MRSVVFFAVVALALAVPTRAGGQPDILLILTDDQRWDTIGGLCAPVACMPTVKNQIQAKGVRFSNAFATTPLCCPSRASLLTGLYAHNHQVWTNDYPRGGARKFYDLGLEAKTLAVWLHGAGYRTALVGKWLNDYAALLESIPFHVPKGWSQWFAFVAPPKSYYNFQVIDAGEDRTAQILSFSSGEYATDVLTQRAVEIVDSTLPDQPLFLYLVPNAPHGGAVPAPQDATKFATLKIPHSPAWNEADVNDKPLWVARLPRFTDADGTRMDNFARRQLETLQAVDRMVKAVLDAFAANGRSNLVVVFTSDNGLMWGEHRILKEKDCVYEECIRIPLIIRVPGIASRVESKIVALMDLAPTLAIIGGAVPPTTNARDLGPLLRDPATLWRDDLLIENIGKEPKYADKEFSAVRTAAHIYVEYKNGDVELYDLRKDPLQLNNVVYLSTYYQVRVDLKTRLDQLKQE